MSSKKGGIIIFTSTLGKWFFGNAPVLFSQGPESSEDKDWVYNVPAASVHSSGPSQQVAGAP